MLALVDMLEDLLDIIDQHNTLYLDPNAENASLDRAGKLLNGIYFELVLPSGVNAYLQSPFGSGKNLLVFFYNDGVRGCHSSVHGDSDAAIIVVDFSLCTIEDVLKCMKWFEGMDISLDMFD